MNRPISSGPQVRNFLLSASSHFYVVFGTVLDPHISLEGLLHDAMQDDDSESQIRHIQECRALLEHHFHEHYASIQASTTSNPSRTTSTLSSDDDFDPYSHYRQNLKVPDTSDELTRYFRLNPIDAHQLGTDALTWWKDHRGAFPNLSRLARDIFSIPGML